MNPKKIIKSMVLHAYNAMLDRKKIRFVLRELIDLKDLKSAVIAVDTLRTQRKLDPIVLEKPPGKRLLIIAPHPDDEVIGPGATLIRHVRSGGQARVLYITSGAKGLSESCEAEATAVSEKVGFEVRFLKAEAQKIPMDDDFLRRFAVSIEEYEPDVIMAPCLYDDHDDHRRVSHMMLEARRKGWLLITAEFWGYQVYSVLPANVMVEMTDLIKEKADAIRLYRTAMRSRDWAHYSLGLNAFNIRFLRGSKGRTISLEAFLVLPLDDYLKLCEPYFADPGRSYYFSAYL